MEHDINGKSVLIVEDDETLLLRLEKALRRKGFEARTALSVEEASESIQTHIPDFAVVDLHLLDGSGLDVVEMLAKQNPDTRTLILTGYGNIPTAVAAMRIGAIDYIAKPAAVEEIVDALLAPPDGRPPAPEVTMTPEKARWEHIESVCQTAGGNVSRAARMLNMHRRTLQRILQRGVE